VAEQELQPCRQTAREIAEFPVIRRLAEGIVEVCIGLFPAS
jgi:hypothetical protein